MRVRLGGFAILARMLDKGRATLVKKNGEYNYNSPRTNISFGSLVSIRTPF
jgi:hypothetical protein